MQLTINKNGNLDTCIPSIPNTIDFINSDTMHFLGNVLPKRLARCQNYLVGLTHRLIQKKHWIMAQNCPSVQPVYKIVTLTCSSPCFPLLLDFPLRGTFSSASAILSLLVLLESLFDSSSRTPAILMCSSI